MEGHHIEGQNNSTNNTTMLDITKKLQTRDGRNVLIKFTDGRSKTHPIVGYIENETSFSFWTLAGIWAGHASPENDLINAAEMHEVPLCADDIKAGDEFLIAGYRYAWCSITDNYVSYAKIGIYSFKELMEYGHKIRSIGETEWRKCSKQEEVPA